MRKSLLKIIVTTSVTAFGTVSLACFGYAAADIFHGRRICQLAGENPDAGLLSTHYELHMAPLTHINIDTPCLILILFMCLASAMIALQGVRMLRGIVSTPARPELSNLSVGFYGDEHVMMSENEIINL
jgi:hypothetical protein